MINADNSNQIQFPHGDSWGELRSLIKVAALICVKNSILCKVCIFS